LFVTSSKLSGKLYKTWDVVCSQITVFLSFRLYVYLPI